MSSKNAAGKKVAFVGLGVMGYPMAGHLVEGGCSVTVFNRTRSRAEDWSKRFSGQIAATPKDAAAQAEIVFSCVGADDDLREVAYGKEGILEGMQPGAIFVDHTTDSANVAREIDEAAQTKNLNFMDAPVSGGQAGAENGKLTVMVGGNNNTFKIIEPIMRCYSHNITHMGEVGNGQLTKMVNQLCIAGVVQGLAEGINFAQRAGLDGEKVLEVISKGAAQSWQMENRGKTMLKGEFEFGFAADWMRKDLGLCFDEAKNNGALLPLAMLVDQFYAHIQQRGGGRWDTSSLIQLLQKL